MVLLIAATAQGGGDDGLVVRRLGVTGNVRPRGQRGVDVESGGPMLFVQLAATPIEVGPVGYERMGDDARFGIDQNAVLWM